MGQSCSWPREVAVGARPIGGGLERARLEMTSSFPSVRLPAHEPRSFEYVQVLGDGREAHGEGICQLAHAGLALPEAAQDGAAGRIR